MKKFFLPFYNNNSTKKQEDSRWGNEILLKMMSLGFMFGFLSPELRHFFKEFTLKIQNYSRLSENDFLGSGEVVLYLALLSALFWGIAELVKAINDCIDVSLKTKSTFAKIVIMSLPLILSTLGIASGIFTRVFYL